MVRVAVIAECSSGAFLIWRDMVPWNCLKITVKMMGRQVSCIFEMSKSFSFCFWWFHGVGCVVHWKCWWQMLLVIYRHWNMVTSCLEIDWKELNDSWQAVWWVETFWIKCSVAVIDFILFYCRLWFNRVSMWLSWVQRVFEYALIRKVSCILKRTSRFAFVVFMLFFFVHCKVWWQMLLVTYRHWNMMESCLEIEWSGVNDSWVVSWTILS